jgi:hypothetical protein
MNIKTLFKVSIICSAFLAANSYAEQYSEKQKIEALNRLAKEANKNQQSTVDQMDLYNQYIFQVTQRANGGYEQVKLNLPDYRTNDQLTEAQKNSISNYIKRSSLIKSMLEVQ